MNKLKILVILLGLFVFGCATLPMRNVSLVDVNIEDVVEKWETIRTEFGGCGIIIMKENPNRNSMVRRIIIGARHNGMVTDFCYKVGKEYRYFLYNLESGEFDRKQPSEGVKRFVDEWLNSCRSESTGFTI